MISCQIGLGRSTPPLSAQPQTTTSTSTPNLQSTHHQRLRYASGDILFKKDVVVVTASESHLWRTETERVK